MCGSLMCLFLALLVHRWYYYHSNGNGIRGNGYLEIIKMSIIRNYIFYKKFYCRQKNIYYNQIFNALFNNYKDVFRNSYIHLLETIF